MSGLRGCWNAGRPRRAGPSVVGLGGAVSGAMSVRRAPLVVGAGVLAFLAGYVVGGVSAVLYAVWSVTTAGERD